MTWCCVWKSFTACSKWYDGYYYSLDYYYSTPIWKLLIKGKKLTAETKLTISFAKERVFKKGSKVQWWVVLSWYYSRADHLYLLSGHWKNGYALERNVEESDAWSKRKTTIKAFLSVVISMNWHWPREISKGLCRISFFYFNWENKTGNYDYLRRTSSYARSQYHPENQLAIYPTGHCPSAKRLPPEVSAFLRSSRTPLLSSSKYRYLFSFLR